MRIDDWWHQREPIGLMQRLLIGAAGVALCAAIILLFIGVISAAIIGISSLAPAGEWWHRIGQYLPTDLTVKQRQWISSAKDRNGISCCSEADGYRPDEQDVEWDAEGGHFRVRLDGKWHAIEDHQLVDAPLNPPNPIGRAVAWWHRPQDPNSFYGERKVRCFAPGPGG